MSNSDSGSDGLGEAEDIPLHVVEEGHSVPSDLETVTSPPSPSNLTNRRSMEYVEYDYALFYKICIGILLLICASLVLMWLAESQFGEGILRPKLFNETCPPDWAGGRTCAKGLWCVEGRCVDDGFNYSAVQTIYVPQNWTDPLPTCPPQHITQQITKIVSFYDFMEFPGSYLRPLNDSRIKAIEQVSYNGCKEICSRETQCIALNYNANNQFCTLMRSFLNPQIESREWIVAFKTF